MPDADATEPAPPKPKKKLVPVLAVTGLMLAEGALIYGAMTLFGGSPGAA